MKNIISFSILILAAICCVGQSQVVEQSQAVEVSSKPSTTKLTVTKADPNVVPFVTAQQWKPGDPDPSGVSMTVRSWKEPNKPNEGNTPTATPDANQAPTPKLKTVHLTVKPELAPKDVQPKAIKAKEQDK